MDGSPLLKREFRLHLFGGPLLERRGAPVGMSPFHGVLLSVLAYHGRRGIRRDRLLSFLWPAGSEGVLRRRLSQMLYSLHQRIGVPELVVSSADRFYLDVDRVEPDLEQFHTALHERRIDEAATLLSREFLGEVNPFPTPELDVWVQERIRQFRADIRTAGARIWGEAEQRGDWERAAKTTGILMSVDPSDEELLRKHLRALGLMGQVEEARAAYVAFSEHAGEEDPGWVPSAPTEQLMARLDTLSRERGPTFLLGRYGLPAQPPLVGRLEEMATLGAVLRDPGEDRVQTVSIVGEPGVGKTRLAWEAMRTLPFDGVRVLSASCSEFERRIPLSPFTSALKPAWVAEASRTLEEPWRAVLLSIFPEWHREPGPPPAIPQIEPSEVPRRLCEAFRQLFMALVRTDPVVLFIDDFHWVDETSLSVLDYIRQRGVGGDLKLVVTMVTGPERAGSTPHPPMPFDPSTRGPFLRIRNLIPDDIEGLLHDYALGLEAPIAAIDLWALTSGNPHHLAEALAALRVARAKSGAAAPFLEELRPLLQERLSRVTQAGRASAQALALSQIPLRIRDLTSICGMPSEAVVSGLEELERLGWACVGSDGIALTSPLLGEVLRDTTPAARAAIIHHALATALSDGATHGQPWIVAHHLIQAQEPEKARRLVLAFAQRALEEGYWDELLNLLTRLLGKTRDIESKQELLRHLAEINFARGDFPAAHTSYISAWQLSLRTGRTSHESTDLRLKALVSELYVGRITPQTAWQSVLAVEAQSAGLCSHSTVIDTYTDILRVAQSREDIKTAEEIMNRGEELLRGSPEDKSLRLRLHLLLCALIFYRGPAAAQRHVSEALELASGSGCNTALLRAHHWNLILLHHKGVLNLPEGLEGRRAAFTAAARAGDTIGRIRMELNNSVWFLDCLEAEAAEVSLKKVEGLLAEDPLPHLRLSWLVNRGELYLLQARWEDAAKDFETALASARAMRLETGELLSAAGLGFARLRLRDRAGAQAIFEEMRPRPKMWTCDPALVYTFLTQYASRHADAEGAIAEAQAVKESVSGRSVPWTLRMSIAVGRAQRNAGVEVNTDDLRRLSLKAEQLGLFEAARQLKDLAR